MSGKSQAAGTASLKLGVPHNKRECSSPRPSHRTEFSAEAVAVDTPSNRRRESNLEKSQGCVQQDRQWWSEPSCPRSLVSAGSQLVTSQPSVLSCHRASNCRHTTILLSPHMGYRLQSAPTNWEPRYVRVRRVTTLEDVTILPSSRSLKRLDQYGIAVAPTHPTARYCKRKFVTIIENEPSTPSKRDDKTTPKSRTVKSLNRDAVSSAERSSAPSQNLSRLSVIKKCEKEPKTSTKVKPDERGTIKINYKSKVSHKKKIYTSESSRLVSPKKTGATVSTERCNISSIKSNDSRKCNKSINEKENKFENENSTKNNKAYEKPKSNTGTPAALTGKPKCTKPQKMYSNVQSKVDTMLKKKVPKEAKVIEQHRIQCTNMSMQKETTVARTEEKTSDHDNHRLPEQRICDIFNNNIAKTSQSELKPETKNQTTETSLEWVIPKDRAYDTREMEIQTEQMSFSELQIPLVTLTKESRNSNTELPANVLDFALPNLQVPTVKISPRGKLKEHLDEQLNGKLNTSIIKATVTYTKKKKINFEVLGSSDLEHTISPTNSLCVPSYPFTVMSVLKKELQQSNQSFEKRNENLHLCSWSDELFSTKAPEKLKRKKLMKPSDIIQQMRDTTNILHTDYLSDQFQKELNFIDSFFDSLQYLENNCVIVNLNSTETLDDELNLSLDGAPSPPSFELLPKIHKIDADNINLNEMNVNSSLCLLNYLIRDERRRAKNLILILKMREDALKDFTKSQILYLENKKRREEEDVSTLKKKQRGALLKLQQECGEMQRMKRALLALSERRKDALIQTKQNIKLRLSNGAQVRMLKSNKKKPQRNLSRKSIILPVKCFDLSGSTQGADDSIDTRHNTIEEINEKQSIADSVAKVAINKIEKSIQTGDSLAEDTGDNTPPDISTDGPPLVKVDGAYLNILFHNLALPQMFSGGKEYEVNESALQNILQSADRLRESTFRNFDDQLDRYKLDKSISKSSTPSTARSLVDEFDEYFSYLGKFDASTSGVETVSDERDKRKNASVDMSHIDDYRRRKQTKLDKNVKERAEEEESKRAVMMEELRRGMEMVVQRGAEKSKKSDSFTNTSNDELDLIRPSKKCVTEVRGRGVGEIERTAHSVSPKEVISVLKRENVIRSMDSLKSPLVRPVKQDSSTSTTSCVGVDDLPLRSKTTATLSEEEELRKKQLAIELEIKALEQQFIVREIPDKPPPPYTPPSTEATGTQTPAPPVIEFTSTEQRIMRTIHSYCDSLYPPADPFQVSNLKPADSLEELLLDFCTDSIKNYKMEKSDEPWHPSNVLPAKLTTTRDSVRKALTDEASSILGLSEKPAPLPGPPILNKRSDYIDDILFAEWRKCEMEWTTLEPDEVNVKNQLFTSIFQKIIDESIEEYKQVLNDHEELPPPK